MAKPKIKPEVWVIEWIDPSDVGESWEDYVKGSAVPEYVSTVGFLLEETEDLYVLTYNRSDDDSILKKAVIPKTHVRRLRKFKYPWAYIGSALPKKKVVKNEDA
jgi:hypothetical protein